MHHRQPYLVHKKEVRSDVLSDAEFACVVQADEEAKARTSIIVGGRRVQVYLPAGAFTTPDVAARLG